MTNTGSPGLLGKAAGSPLSYSTRRSLRPAFLSTARNKKNGIFMKQIKNPNSIA